MILRDLMNIIEKKYPCSLAESWDNVGLMFGDDQQEIHKVLVALEANEAVIEEAIAQEVDLIITHHPFYFSKFRSITSDTMKGKLTLRLMKHNIALYSMHTNYDIAFDGMNDQFLKHIGFTSDAIFLPADAPAWYLEEHGGKAPGLGRICTLNNSMTLVELCNHLKEKLHMHQIRFVGHPDTIITNVAVITGAAADYYNDAKAAGADVLISGDLKYHTAQDAFDAKMPIIDCGHYETEHIFSHALCDYLATIPEIHCIPSRLNINPFQTI